MTYDFERELGFAERQEAFPAVRAYPTTLSWDEMVRAPFRHCTACGVDYTDSEFEDAQQRAFDSTL